MPPVLNTIHKLFSIFKSQLLSKHTTSHTKPFCDKYFTDLSSLSKNRLSAFYFSTILNNWQPNLFYTFQQTPIQHSPAFIET